MSRFQSSFRSWIYGPAIRPWGLVGPILVLFICLPMLRPLRHPAEVSDDEAIRLSTIRALAERHTLALPPTVHAPASHAVISGTRIFSDQPPVFAILLAGPYWLMMRSGITFNTNPVLTPYLLTLLGTTLPVALVAALIYRMARMFELRRAWRAILSVTTVFGSGLLSYATVLNAHAAAAAMLMGAVGCIVHVTTSKRNVHSGTWFMIAGLCAALAATFDPPAAIIGLGLIFVILAIRLRPLLRIAGVFLFLLGAAPPLALHVVASQSSTKHLIPISLTRDLSGRLSIPAPSPQASSLDNSDDDELASQSWWLVAGKYINRWLASLLGSHGLFSHFPVLIFGACGLAAVMHRNWPGWTKMLAVVTASGALSVIGLYCCSQADWREAMFATRWFVLFVPLVLFWTGAWMRRDHATITWTIAGLLLAFSASVSVIGATNPYPRQGFDRYTAVGALMQLIHENPSSPSGAGFARADLP